jgi:hypothetical protein
LYDNSSVEIVWGYLGGLFHVVWKFYRNCLWNILNKQLVDHLYVNQNIFHFLFFRIFFFNQTIRTCNIFFSIIKTFRSAINSPSISHSIHTTAYNLLLYRDYHIRQLFLQGTIPFINVDNKITILLVYINSHDLVHHNIYSRLNKQSLGEQYVDKTESLYYLESSLINKLISIRIMIDGYFNLSLSFRLDLGSISELQKTMWSTAIRWGLCNEIV